MDTKEIMPSTEHLDTQSHAKIWFSDNPDVFVNLENELRTVRFLQNNPKPATLTIIYSSKLLGQKGLEEKERFELQHPDIVLVDFDTTLEDKCITQRDCKLYYYAKDELLYSNNRGGNLGAASDIVRLITPAVEMGTYSDFDIQIKTKGLEHYIPLREGFVGNIGSIINGSREILSTCNDILGFSKDPSSGKLTPRALELLEYIQDCLIENYSNPFNCLRKRFSAQSLLAQTILNASLEKAHPDMSVIKLRNQLNYLNLNSAYMLLKVALPLNGGFLNFSADQIARINKDFSEEHRTDFSERFTTEEIISIKTNVLNVLLFKVESQIQEASMLENNIESIPEDQKSDVDLFLNLVKPKIPRIPHIRNLIKNQRFEEAIQLINKPSPGLESLNKDFLLKRESVINFSGPMILCDALYRCKEDSTPKYSTVIELGKACAFIENPSLASAYIAQSSLPFGSSLADMSKKATDSQGVTSPRNISDVSWLPEGKTDQLVRESRYNSAATTIQKNLQKIITKSKNRVK